MNITSNISTHLEQYESQSQALTYYQTLYDILIALDLPKTEAYGYAALHILHNLTIRLKDGRVLSEFDSSIGSYDDIAEAIAVLFAEIDADPMSWKIGRVVYLDTPAVTKAMIDVEQRLRALAIVHEVEGTFLPD